MARIAYVVLWTLAISPATAQGRIDPELTSEAAIKRAVEDIGKMQEPELRSLMSYLVECSDRGSVNPTIMRACDSAALRYQIEFKQSRAVDGVIDQIQEIVKVQRAIRSVGVQGGNTDFINGVDQKLRAAVGEALRAKPRSP